MSVLLKQAVTIPDDAAVDPPASEVNVPLAAVKRCTLRANPDGAFAKPPAARLKKRFQPENKAFCAVEIFSYATPKTGGKNFVEAIHASRAGRWRPALGRIAPAPATESGAIRPSGT